MWGEIRDCFTPIEELKENFEDFTEIEDYKYSVLPNVDEDLRKCDGKDQDGNDLKNGKRTNNVGNVLDDECTNDLGNSNSLNNSRSGPNHCR